MYFFEDRVLKSWAVSRVVLFSAVGTVLMLPSFFVAVAVGN